MPDRFGETIHEKYGHSPDEYAAVGAAFSDEFVEKFTAFTYDTVNRQLHYFGVPTSPFGALEAARTIVALVLRWAVLDGYVTLTDKGEKAVVGAEVPSPETPSAQLRLIDGEG